MEVARGATCALLVKEAATRFASRPFLGLRRPDEPAFRWRSYGDVAAEAESLAAALTRAGVPSRQPAVLCADLCPAYVSATLGLLLRGCVLVPLHGALDEAALAQVLQLTSPAVCLVASAYVSKLLAATRQVGKRPLVVLLPDDFGLSLEPPAAAAAEVTSLDALLAAAAGQPAPPPPPLQPSDVSAVLFTSGSTGRPKGAMFTGQNN